ncbi:MAG: hypothetical protein ABI846_14995 [Rudaea sp.]
MRQLSAHETRAVGAAGETPLVDPGPQAATEIDRILDQLQHLRDRPGTF